MPLKMASACKARLRNVEGWIMKGLSLGFLGGEGGSAPVAVSGMEPRVEPAQQPDRAQRLADLVLEGLHLGEYEQAGVVHYGFGHAERSRQHPGAKLERP